MNHIPSAHSALLIPYKQGHCVKFEHKILHIASELNASKWKEKKEVKIFKKW